jgi:iron(III) transport system substrate-binding protein
MHRHLIFGAATAAFLLTGASVPASAMDKYDPKILAAAKKEGEIVVYHSVNRKVLKKLCKAYEKKFGIKTNCTRKSSGGIVKMITADTMAGISKCDIVSVGDAGMFLIWKAKKSIQPYKSVNAGKMRADLVDPEGWHHPARLTYYGISYSTKKVKPGEAPKDWEDVLDPKWKGKIGVVNPRTAGPARLWLSGMLKKYGWGYFQKLSKQKPLMIKSSSTAAKLLVRGEVSVIVPGSDHGVSKRKKKKQPVELVYPKSGLMGKDSRVAICAGAPNLNAAKLWIDFETSHEGQSIVTSVGAYPPTREDVKVGFSKFRPSAKVYKKENSTWISPEHLRDEGPKERKKFERIMKAGMGS